MITARIKLDDYPWRDDCLLPDDIMDRPLLQIAKAGVESWWVAKHNYHGYYRVAHDTVRDAKLADGMFTCNVDRGRTPLAIDLSQAGGPW